MSGLGSVRKSATESNGSEIGREKENNLKTSISCHKTRRKSTSSVSNYARSKRQCREDVRDITKNNKAEEEEIMLLMMMKKKMKAIIITGTRSGNTSNV